MREYDNDDEMLNSLVKQEEARERKLLAYLKKSGRPKRDKIISEDEILNVKILANLHDDSRDLIAAIKAL